MIMMGDRQEETIRRCREALPNLKNDIQKIRSMIKISDLNQIDRSTPEGRLLWAALIELTTRLHTDKTPYQVINKLNDIARQGDQDINEKNRLSTQQQKDKIAAEHNVLLYLDAFEQSAGRIIESIDVIGVDSFIPTKGRKITSVRFNLKSL